MNGEGLCFALRSHCARFFSFPKMKGRGEGTAETVSTRKAKPGHEELCLPHRIKHQAKAEGQEWNEFDLWKQSTLLGASGWSRRKGSEHNPAQQPDLQHPQRELEQRSFHSH